MKRILTLATVAIAVSAGAALPAAGSDCNAARCAAQPTIEALCPCDDTAFAGRPQYADCVARVVEQMAKTGEIPSNCRGKIRNCAARSACGRADAVTCRTGRRCWVAASSVQCLAAGGAAGSGSCCTDCSAH
jgi:hypothetical protein